VPGRVYAGEVERSENLDPVVTLAVAIAPRAAAPPRDFKNRSVLLAELNLKFLSEVATRFRFAETGKVYIVDEKGFLIIDPDISLVLKRPDLSDRAVVREILEKKSGARAARHTNNRGVPVEASGIFVPGLEWGIVSEQDLAEVNALRNRILLLAAISLSIGVSLVAVLAANSRVTARTNTRLRELITELESVGKMLVRRDLELTLANARLEELDIVKSEFVSIAAHQLRTPLTGIRWSYQALLEAGGGAEKLKPAERHLLESGLGATLRMIELVNDLLNVARIEEGRFGMRLRKQPLAPVVDAFTQRYAELAKEKGISFSFQIPRDLPLQDIAFDEERIGLVLDNMLDNALKYTSAGGKIAVRMSR
jgi:signal transduction histidine kinase